MTVAAYGSWASNVTIDDLTGATVQLGGPAFDGDDIYWTESRASDGGRISLWRRRFDPDRPDADRVEITPEINVRSAVHEYGGGAWAVRDGMVIVTDFTDHSVNLIDRTGSRRLLAVDGQRFAAFELHPDRDLALAVREDHGVARAGGETPLQPPAGSGADDESRARGQSDGDSNASAATAEPVNSVVAIRLSDGEQTVLCSGADFYDNPTLAGGQLAWVEWDHPNMPWDTTRLMAGVLGDDRRVTDVVQVAGDREEAVGNPVWRAAAGGDELVFTTDRTGFWNLYAWHRGAGAGEDAVRALHRHDFDFDFARPAWQLGGHDFAVLDAQRLLVCWLREGYAKLGILDGDGELTELESTGTEVLSLAARPAENSTLVGVHVVFADRPNALCLLDLDSGDRFILRRSSTRDIDPKQVSEPVPIHYGDARADADAHAWYYPPTNPDFTAPEGELPPLRVLSHGGPTSFSSAGYSPSVQYWTSRGWAVVDVNYGGSTGYGRAYRNRLKGQWGLVDVRDCENAAKHLVVKRLADPNRIAIEGGSAGGYTTLRALTTSNVFTAGVSYFGVADLEALARDTHKFESQYLFGLVGGRWPEQREVYLERSPIHHLDRLHCPMLILQGEDDKVVPPNQAIEMAAALREKGLPLALKLYPREGHGFRRAETVQSALESSQSFYGQVFGFIPADDIAPLEVENLAADAG